MNFKDLISTRDNRLSSSKIAFWLFFLVLIFRIILYGMSEFTKEALIFIITFFSYKGLKVIKLNR